MTINPEPLCPVCGDRRARVKYASRSEAPLDARMTTDRYGAFGRIVRCLNCGVEYRHPRPSDEEVRRSYSEMRDDDYLRESDSRHINAHLSLRAIKRCVSEGSLLDVGCSTGFLLDAARPDFQVRGIELSAWAAEQARKKLGLTVDAVGWEKAAFPPASFDVVCFVDVLEHLADPAGALNWASGLLRPGGILYLVTPDAGSLSARLMGRFWWGYRPAHLVYFSRRTLSELVERSGLRVEKTRSYGRLFPYGYWLSRLQDYPTPIRALARAAVALLGGPDKVAYINTRDSIEICARKPAQLK